MPATLWKVVRPQRSRTRAMPSASVVTPTPDHLEIWQSAPGHHALGQHHGRCERTASAFGGLIYIDVPTSAAGGQPSPSPSQRAVEARLFVPGQTTDAEWNSKIKNTPAPWAEFACDKLIFPAPRRTRAGGTIPPSSCSYWKKVVEAQDDLHQPDRRAQAAQERIVADVQISAGYMHSGYPIMIPTRASDEMVTFSRLKFPGWGFYHEIGHNHQRKTFTFDGAGEVTNNVIGMYCYHEVLKKDSAHRPHGDHRGRAARQHSGDQTGQR